MLVTHKKSAEDPAESEIGNFGVSSRNGGSTDQSVDGAAVSPRSDKALSEIPASNAQNLGRTKKKSWNPRVHAARSKSSEKVKLLF